MDTVDHLISEWATTDGTNRHTNDILEELKLRLSVISATSFTAGVFSGEEVKMLAQIDPFYIEKLIKYVGELDEKNIRDILLVAFQLGRCVELDKQFNSQENT